MKEKQGILWQFLFFLGEVNVVSDFVIFSPQTTCSTKEAINVMLSNTRKVSVNHSSPKALRSRSDIIQLGSLAKCVLSDFELERT